MRRVNINILGFSEVRWSVTDQVRIDGHKMYYSGNNKPQHNNGVAIIIDKKINRSLMKFIPLSNNPDTDNSEVQQLCKTTKKTEVNIIMSDFNAKVLK